MRSLIYVTLASASLLLTACETTPKVSTLSEPTYEQAQNNAFSVANYNAVGELMKRYPAAPAMATNAADGGTGAPFIIATLVNIDQLEQSSTLGRLISEQVASRMSQLGYGVLELKVRNGVYMKRNEGELILTREVRDIARQHNARAIVAGTYAESADRVFVNMKVVELDSNVVLGAVDYQLDRDALVRSLLPARQ